MEQAVVELDFVGRLNHRYGEGTPGGGKSIKKSTEVGSSQALAVAGGERRGAVGSWTSEGGGSPRLWARELGLDRVSSREPLRVCPKRVSG